MMLIKDKKELYKQLSNFNPDCIFCKKVKITNIRTNETKLFKDCIVIKDNYENIYYIVECINNKLKAYPYNHQIHLLDMDLTGERL